MGLLQIATSREYSLEDDSIAPTIIAFRDATPDEHMAFQSERTLLLRAMSSPSTLDEAKTFRLFIWRAVLNLITDVRNAMVPSADGPVTLAWPGDGAAIWKAMPPAQLDLFKDHVVALNWPNSRDEHRAALKRGGRTPN